VFFQYASGLVNAIPVLCRPPFFETTEKSDGPAAKEIPMVLQSVYLRDIPMEENRKHHLLVPAIHLSEPPQPPEEVLSKLIHVQAMVSEYATKFPFDPGLLVPSMIIMTAKSGEYSLIVAFSFLLSALQVDTVGFLKTVLDTRLFDPRVTVFTSTSVDRTTHNVRSLVYKYLIFRDSVGWRVYVDAFVNHPLMIAELFYRASIAIRDIPQAVFLDGAFHQLLATVIVSLQAVNSKLRSEEVSELTFEDWFHAMSDGEIASAIVDDCQQVECARICLLKFMSRLFRYPEKAVPVHASVHFLPAVFSLLCECNCRPIIATILRKLWIIPEVSLEPVARFASGIPLRTTTNDQHLQSLTVYYGVVNEILLFRADQTCYFSGFVRVLIDFIVRIDPSSHLLHVILRFCSLVARRFEPLEISGLSAVIQKVEGDNPSDVIYDDLVDMLTSVSNHNLISRPEVSSLLFDAFLRSPKWEKVADCFLSLCEHSVANTLALHHAKLDLAILDLIGDGKMPWNEKALFLVETIASRVSSMSVVHRFVSLMCPVESRYLPDHIIDYVRTLSAICGRHRAIPSVFFPVSVSGPVVRIPSMSGTWVSQGFTFSIWLFAEPDDTPFIGKLLMIQDKSNRAVLGIFFSGMAVHVNTNKIPLSIPAGVWTTVSLSFAARLAHVSVSIGGLPPYELVLSAKDAPTGPCEWCVGGSDTPSDCDLLFVNSFSVSRSDGAIVSVTPSTLEALLEDGRLHKPRAIELTGHHHQRVLSFPDVLIQFYKVELLLPLFAQIDFRLQSTRDHVSTSYVALIVTAITNLFLLSDDAQEGFLQSHGCEIVAYLLSANSHRHLTFDLYSHLLALYEVIRIAGLQASLVDQLLLNSSLWVLASCASVLEVVSHWVHIFAPAHRKLVCDIRPVSRLVRDLPLFYWLYPGDVLDRHQEIRSALLQLICLVAEWQLSIDDVNALLASCIAADDRDFSRDLLHLLRVMLHTGNSHLRRVLGNAAYSTTLPLTYLLHSPDPDVVFAVIDTFFALHDEELQLEPSLAHHVEVMTAFLAPRALHGALVAILVEASLSYPHLLSLACFIVAEAGGEALDALQRTLGPNEGFCIDERWLLWPLVIAVKFQSSTDFMLQFIVASARGGWAQICASLECVTAGLSVDSVPLHRALLITIARFIREGSYDIGEFVRIAHRFIFTKPTEFICPALAAAYAVSPFCSMFDLTVSDSGNSSTCSDYRLVPERPVDSDSRDPLFYRRLAAFLRRKHTVRYGVEIAEDGSWADAELAGLLCDVVDHARPNQFERLARAIRDRDWKALSELYGDAKTDTRILEIDKIGMRWLKFRKQAQAWTTSAVLSYCDDFLNKAYWQLGEDDRSLETAKASAHKSWMRLWRRLTFERAPWEKSLRAPEIHYKRDGVLQRDFCPHRLKRHGKFKSHMEASISRDIGSTATAQAKIDAHREELAQRYKETAPPQLLEISEAPVDTEGAPSKITSRDAGFFTCTEAFYMTLQKSVLCTFVLNHSDIQIVVPGREGPVCKTIEAVSVAYVFLRCYLHRPTAIEVITRFGRSYFVRFASQPSLPVLRMISKLASWRHVLVQTVPHARFVEEQHLTDRWLTGAFSNFEYLMRLNMLGGRSFTVTSLYPIFPWVLKDYQSTRIDLADPAVYRDFSLPVGAFTPERLAELQATMDDCIQFGQTPFLYRACYSSPFLVFLWLIRLEPFTTLNIDLQSGKFDHAARTFYSIDTAFWSASSQQNDYRELIPEFFFQHTFLENANHFDLGSIDGIPVNDVVLPPWSRSAIDFVYIHRKALESPHVTAHLHEWIDLIWGFRQRGEAAVSAQNTFDPAMYDSIWDGNQDDRGRSVCESMLENGGHIPPQLFVEPHPQKILKPNPRAFGGDSVVKLDVQHAQAGHITWTASRTFRYVCLADGQLLTADVVLREDTQEDLKTRLISEIDAPDVSHALFFVSSNHLKLFVVSDRIVPLAISIEAATGHVIKLPGQMSAITCIAASHSLLVTGGRDTVTNVWEISGAPRFSIASYRDEIVCVSAAQQFGLIVSSTRDGSIIMISAASGAVTRVIELAPACAVLVEISAGWGFVVAHTTVTRNGIPEFYVEVYSVNGDFIRRRKIPFAIRGWHGWVSRDGFDYIVALSEGGELYAFEVFWVDLEEPFVKITGNVVAMEYILEEDVLAVATEGQIMFFSALHMKTERFRRTVFGAL
jgi:hypothetical protein